MTFVDLPLLTENVISVLSTSVVTGSKSFVLSTSHGIAHSIELGVPRY